MKIIVTGAAGFIGSHLCDRLLKDGHDVLALDNLSTGTLDNIPKHEKMTFLRFDIGNKGHYIQRAHYLKNVDLVFHVAAHARIQTSIKHPEATFADNLYGTMMLLQAMRQHGIKNIVYSSTSSSYGRKNGLPAREDMAPDCLTPYAATKVGAELLIKSYGVCYGINNITLKYFNVYGPRSPEKGEYAPVIGLFFRQALKDKKNLTIVGDGEQRRDMTHIDDIVEANIAAMNKLIQLTETQKRNAQKNPLDGLEYEDNVTGMTFNVGCGKNYSINETAKMVLESLQTEGLAKDISTESIPIRPAEARATLADISLAREYLEWSPKISLQEGIERIKPYYVHKYGYKMKTEGYYQRRGNLDHLFK